MKSIELAKEITATMTLRLPGTVGKIANKMRYVDTKAPELLKGGIIRSIPEGKFEQVKAIGISSISNSLQAFGGVLYGAAALRHDISLAGNRVTETFQDSRIDINEMNYLDTKQRLTWKEYKLVYELLEDVLTDSSLPDIIILDVPLTLQRTEQSNKLEVEEIKSEWDDTLARVQAFWEKHLSKIFPENPEGPMLVALTRRYFGAALHAIKEKGKDASPEEIDPAAINLISQNWGRLEEVGIMRIVRGLLRAGKRSAAYYYEALGAALQRSEPKLVSGYGLLGLHTQIGFKTPVWQVETIGGTEHGRWSSEKIDHMCSLIAYLTLYDSPKMLPLPLWYAKKLVRMPKSILINYYRETLRLLQEETVDAAWLTGMDELMEDGAEDFKIFGR